MEQTNKDKTKILRTLLDEPTHRKFKAISAELGITMAKLLEVMIHDKINQMNREDL
jgi:antitoxin component of RelBE/YafQ-DinJ toxin-antitoxin module